MTSEGKAQLAGIQVLRRAVPPAKSGPVTRRSGCGGHGKRLGKDPQTTTVYPPGFKFLSWKLSVASLNPAETEVSSTTVRAYSNVS
jgi:hypothetical protein